MLKTILLSASLVMVSMSASAAPCASCARVSKLTAEIEALNYANQNDQFTGGEKAEAALLEIANFAKVKKADPTRMELFNSLLALAQAAAPYDEESAIADQLSQLVMAQPSLKEAYNNFVRVSEKTPSAESCKQQLLKTSVAEQMCFKAAGIKGQDGDRASEEKAKSCPSGFNFDECLDKIKK